MTFISSHSITQKKNTIHIVATDGNTSNLTVNLEVK